MKNIFDENDTREFVSRIQSLTPETKALWGKMTVAQMLAHCSVSYEMVFEDYHKKPNGFKRAILKMFVKPIVVNEKPYKRNSPTAPQFLVSADKDFDLEQKRLIEYVIKTKEAGERFFKEKESLSFGKLSIPEWNNMFAKHLDHHLTQFGV